MTFTNEKNHHSHLFLALTALEEFWDLSQPILFLGDWCKLYNKKKPWENLETKKLDSLELEDSYSFNAFNKTVQIYETILPVLSNWLNKIHGTKHSLRYWRIVIGQFLLWYIQVVNHRLIYLRTAQKLYPELNTIGMSSSSYLSPINTREFSFFASESDAWNLQLMTQIINYLKFDISIKYKDYSWDQEIEQRKKLFGNYVPLSLKAKFKIKIIQQLTKLNKSNIIGISSLVQEFSKMNFIYLIILSKFRILPLPQLRSVEQSAVTKNKINFSMRNEIPHLSVSDDFSRLILDTLKINMPLNFIEFYKQEAKESESCFPYAAKVIINGWMHDDRMKLCGANRAENGAKLIGVQHGGGYGAVKYCSHELLERKNTDLFISWGWEDKNDVISAPSINVCERLSEAKSKQKQINKTNLILWAANEGTRYLTYIASDLNHTKTQYFDWQCRFVTALPPDILSDVEMRLRPFSKYADYIQYRMPTIKIRNPKEKGSFFDLLLSAKILVSDNLCSTFHYGLAYNIPTILFWDKNLWQIREEAKMYFNELHQVGIYHETPESAADMIKNISKNVDHWWKSQPVQKARKRFCDRFARTSPDWLSQWARILLAI